jgi:hypothetical protein
MLLMSLKVLSGYEADRLEYEEVSFLVLVRHVQDSLTGEWPFAPPNNEFTGI